MSQNQDMFRKCVGYLLALALFVPWHGAEASSSFKMLYSFPGGAPGAYPYSGLITDATGNRYGTTYAGGGTGCSGELGCGTVFKLKPDGTETVLYAFKGGSGDGANPTASLIMDGNGNLYGTTSAGGTTACEATYGCGTIFKLAPDGKETVLYIFAGIPDGAEPQAGLISDGKGNLYGTAEIGGAGCSFNTNGGCGTVFKVAPDGSFTVVYTFCHSQNCPDGAFPTGGLIRDDKGNLYGTAFAGGNCGYADFSGCGVVFKLARNGTETVLHTFSGYPDGIAPYAGLTADKAGNFYGTTVYGGNGEPCPTDYGCGAVFKLAPDGTETVLYGFCQISSSCPDGYQPFAGVILDAKGNLYGTTYAGGNSGCNQDEGCGVVFKLAPGGTETVLHTFAYADGSNPSGGLIKDSTGYLYGTTQGGGAGYGTIFKLKK